LKTNDFYKRAGEDMIENLLIKSGREKKKSLISLFLVAVISMTSCSNGTGTTGPNQVVLSDAEKVAADAGSLGVGYAGSDNSTSVTGNLVLPAKGENGSTIVWSAAYTADGTDASAVIAADGTLTRPPFGSGDAAVTLTAVITSGGESQTVTFDLVVLETPPTDAEAIAADVATLSIGYNGTDSATSVTTDLGLNTSGPSGTTIAWGSDTPGVVTINGVVTRPAFGSGDATVVLTATVSKGVATPQTVGYTVTVLQVPPTDAEAIAADLASLAIGYSGTDTASSVTGNLTLPLTGANGTTVTWSSDTPGVVAGDGTVVRPAIGSGNATVILTASVSKGVEPAQSVTFVLTVIEGDNIPPVPGNGGVITLLDFVLDPSGRPNWQTIFSWAVATDNQTVDANLQYKLYYSTQNNISTLADVQANGTLLGTLTNLAGTPAMSAQITAPLWVEGAVMYAITIVVTDQAGNSALYTTRVYDSLTEDFDGDAIVDAYDADDDNDGYPDMFFSFKFDNCRFVSNADQADANADGIGDVCQPQYILP